MTDLSPAAQSVINAAVEAGGGYGRATPVLHARIAAALRAAADGCNPDWLALTVLHNLYYIADELEAQ
jgi:predicted HD phosphohydrolase